MKTYLVTIPIAGHASFEIEAESAEAAVEKAWEMDVQSPCAEVSYEMLSSFGRGNVCSCPSPWEVTVEEV